MKQAYSLEANTERMDERNALNMVDSGQVLETIGCEDISR
jgi:hypothetical protein